MPKNERKIKIKQPPSLAKEANVVAQFIGQMRLMNQATTEIWG